jgi:hypothetical protein
MEWLWGTASTSNIEILERFHSKDLGVIVDEPWFVPSTVIRRDLRKPTFKEVRHYSSQHSARLKVHPDNLVVNLVVQTDIRRLRKY